MTSVSNLSMTGNQYHLPDNKVQNEDTFSMNSDEIVFLSGIILVFVLFLKKCVMLYKDSGLVPSLHM